MAVDKDLVSVQQARDLVESAHGAQKVLARFEQAMSAPQMASAAQKVLPPDVATMEIGVAQSAHSGVIDSARQYAESLSDRWASTHEMIQQAVRKESFSPKDMLVIQWEVIKVGLNLATVPWFMRRMLTPAGDGRIVGPMEPPSLLAVNPPAVG